MTLLRRNKTESVSRIGVKPLNGGVEGGGRFTSIVFLGLATGLNALGPFLVIPSVTRTSGVDGWGALALGTSVGTIGSVIVMWGWAVHGPVLTADSDSEEKRNVVGAMSAFCRVPLLLPTAIAAATLGALLSPGYRTFAALVAIAFCMSGLTFVWHFVGSQRSNLVLIVDSLPRFAAAGLASLGIYLTGELIIYPVLLMACGILTTLWSMKLVGVFKSSLSVSRDNLRRSYSATAGAGVSQLASAVYINGAVTLVAFGSAVALPVFSAGNRLYLALITAAVPVFQFFVGYVGTPGRGIDRYASRVKKALLVQSVMAVACGVFAPFVFVWLSPLVFTDQIEIPFSIFFLSGWCAAVVIVNRAVTSHLLLANERSSLLAKAAVAGAIFAAIAIPAGAKIGGAVWATVSVLTTEILVCVICSVGAWSAWRSGAHVRMPDDGVMR